MVSCQYVFTSGYVRTVMAAAADYTFDVALFAYRIAMLQKKALNLFPVSQPSLFYQRSQLALSLPIGNDGNQVI